MARLTRFGMVGLVMIFLVVGSIQIFSISPTLAATIDDISATCRYVTVSGKTEANTSYVKIQVALASNLTEIIGQQVVSTNGHLRAGSSYKARLDIRGAHIVDGTLLAIAIGEWDGKKYIQPATIISANCNPSGIVSPTLTPSITPTTDPLFAFPTPTPTEVYRTRIPVISTPTLTATPR